MTAPIEQWYREHRARVYGFLLRRTSGNRQLAEDLTQETFVRAMQAADRYRDEGKPTALLLTIARNLLADHWKSYAGGRTEAVDEVNEAGLLHMAEPVDPAASAVAQDTRAALSAALRQLTPRQQRVMLLRYIHGLSIVETAEALGAANVGQVKALTFRATQRLAADRKLQEAISS